jgi:signal transduction histidine kinase
MREKVFDKFVTASSQRTGIGLGLPIAKRIIEAHGGTITLESELGRGTTVRFSLPGA